MSADKYLLRGVSSKKEDVHNSIARLDKGIAPGAFCKILADVLDPQGAILLHADGAGTKASLAWMYWKETGDASVFRGIARDAFVMNLDDMICAGALDNFAISSTLGRNKALVPGEIVAEIISATEECIEQLHSWGAKAVNAGGETADVGDLVRTLIVDQTFLSRIKRADIIDASAITSGLAIVGFASYGQAVYESSYNAGMGSNGLTSARHDLLCNEYAQKYPQSFDAALPSGVVYSGKFKLTDNLAGTDVNIGKAILSPTRTYYPLVKQALSNLRPKIKGILHCTGGGQTKCLRFGSSVRYIKDNLFDFPPLFKELAAVNDAKQMYEVFNCGHRLEIVCEESAVKELISIASNLNIESRVVGRTEAAPGANTLVIEHQNKRFEWDAP